MKHRHNAFFKFKTFMNVFSAFCCILAYLSLFVHRISCLNISYRTYWIKLYSEVRVDDNTIMTAKQIKELQKRNAQLEEENIILKKALAIMTPRSGKE